MIFGKRKESSDGVEELRQGAQSEILLVGEGIPSTVIEACRTKAPDCQARALTVAEFSVQSAKHARYVVAVFQTKEALVKIQDVVIQLRINQDSGFPTLLVLSRPTELRMLGNWLSEQAQTENLQGLRLGVAMSIEELPSIFAKRLTPVKGPSIIRMPESPEVECKAFKNFFAISDDLRGIVKMMKELAENNISRVYLLGAPGAGKTTLAYYYFLRRGKGNFVAVNLTAESTGDKESMKSLLCGHVPGAMAGANSREGALSFAADGVCFLDESHGVTGVVMQVLMEVLDSGQFLPFGATKKRSLDCAVIFASNRSWEALREMMNMDEHARLGATIIKLTDLAAREEDLIAVLATTLENFARKCTTWSPPQGVTPEAWAEYKKCQWRGNTRTLIRVTETACVSFASAGSPQNLIGPEFVQEGIDLWEPETHSTAGMYVSFRPTEKPPIEDRQPDSTTTARFSAQRE